MDWVANLLGNAASGGVFGLLGSTIGGVFKYFQIKQQQKFEEKKWGHELALINKEHEREREEDEHELSIVSQQGAWQGLEASVQADASSGETYKWAVAIKVLYRPLLTSALVIIAYLMFKDLSAMLAGADENSVLTRMFSVDQARELLVYIVNSLVFSASTAVVWWFGDRAFAPPGMKNR